MDGRSARTDETASASNESDKDPRGPYEITVGGKIWKVFVGGGSRFGATGPDGRVTEGDLGSSVDRRRKP